MSFVRRKSMGSIDSRYWPAVMVRFLVSLAALAVLVAAWPQARTRTTTADISADEMIFRFGRNEFEFRGNCVLKIKGPNTAEMVAPRMVFKLSSGGASLASLTAYGPVKMTIITAKDASGQRRRIVARCSEKATYNEASQLVEMIGDGVADIVTLPETPQSPRFHFNMDYLKVNLRTGELTAKPAKVRFEGMLPAESSEGQ